jgi:uncharacterized Ntn-hydrolase superfamily protein
MKCISFLIMMALCSATIAQDTFSICAFDPETGEVGSAGATCIASSLFSAIIISDVHPGIGVVHTQSYWIENNQDYAGQLMADGHSAQQIIDSLILHDWENTPEYRQYGVVRYDQGGQSAAFTGDSCMDYKNHILGPTYAIQGNILLGQQILDSMETRFNNTQGDLACKLMSALQGAKVIGADTRCEDDGISSFSAFVRVAQIDDDYGDVSLDISVNTYSTGTEPIDSLQTLFEQAGGCVLTRIDEIEKNSFVISGTGDVMNISFIRPINRVEVFDINGRKVYEEDKLFNNQVTVLTNSFSPGVLLVRIFSNDVVLSKTWLKE